MREVLNPGNPDIAIESPPCQPRNHRCVEDGGSTHRGFPDILHKRSSVMVNERILRQVRANRSIMRRDGKKIISVIGSPRVDGNSATIGKRFCDTGEKLGAEVRTFVLNKLRYQGCQGCMLCKTKLERFALEDDLTEVLDAIRNTDVLVLSSPVYFWDVSGQLKTFMDRTFLIPGARFYYQSRQITTCAGEEAGLHTRSEQPGPNKLSRHLPQV